MGKAKQAEMERRRHPRVPVALEVEHRLSLEEPLSKAVATDLSESGLFLETSRKPEVGDTFEVRISAEEGSPVEAYCRVARVTRSGVGAEFIQMESDAAVVLAQVLDSKA